MALISRPAQIEVVSPHSADILQEVCDLGCSHLPALQWRNSPRTVIAEDECQEGPGAESSEMLS